MPQKILLIGHLVSAPLAVYPPSAGRFALRVVSESTTGPLQTLVITETPDRDFVSTCRAGDLLYVEGDYVPPHKPGIDPIFSTVRASGLLRLASPPDEPQPCAFTAVIRWQSDQDPAWELETHHLGFDSPEAAALYADGIGPHSADHLIASRAGAFELALNDGTSFPLHPSQTRVWRSEHGPGKLLASVHDDGFRPVDIELRALAQALRRRPFFTRLHFYLLGPASQVLDASIGHGADGRPYVQLTDVARISSWTGQQTHDQMPQLASIR